MRAPALLLLLRRLALLPVVMAGVLALTFAFTTLIPSDPARLLAGDAASEATVAAMRHRMGLDQPLPTRFARYAGRILRGDLGVSLRTGNPVAADLGAAFPATAELGLVSAGLILAAGLPLGLAAARRRGGALDRLVRIGGVAGLSVPSFWLGLVLVLLFYGRLGWLPAGGRVDPALPPVPAVTGLLLVDGLLALRPAIAWDALRHLALPALTLALVNVGAVARLARACLIEAMAEPHMLTVRAAGLGSRIAGRYALRVAALPLITAFGIMLADLLAGAVVTETIFSWPGIGGYTVASIESLDFPAIMGTTLLVGSVYVLANAAVDALAVLLDPRLA